MATIKTKIIEDLFNIRWKQTGITSGTFQGNPVVGLDEVQIAIRSHNTAHPQLTAMSSRNPANFFKDFRRNTARANLNWPTSVFACGYTGRQRKVVQSGCFEFIPVPPGQITPYVYVVPPPLSTSPGHIIESISLPLASRLLGRPDEAWLAQVVVRLRVIETHLVLSPSCIQSLDHLVMGVKLANAEIDAMYLAYLDDGSELVVICEVKSKTDDIVVEQIIDQVLAVFEMKGMERQDRVMPIAIKSIGKSKIHLVQFEPVTKSMALNLNNLVVILDKIYELRPAVPGIGF